MLLDNAMKKGAFYLKN